MDMADVDKCIRPYAIPLEDDASLRVGAIGPHYQETWQKEDAALVVSLSTSQAPSSSSPKKATTSRKKLSQCSPNIRRQRTNSRDALTSVVISPISQTDPDNELCHCCWHGDVSEGNEILFCDKCNVAVHQWCYDINEIPENEWFCRACGYVMEKKKVAGPNAAVEPPKCAVCLKGGGALIKTTSIDPETGETRWAHAFCCTWLPEMYVPEHHTDKTLYCGLDTALAERSALTCSICKKKGGACIQCSYGNCTVAYHPLCCRDANYRMEDVIESGTESLTHASYCPKHARMALSRKLSLERVDEQPNQHDTAPGDESADDVRAGAAAGGVDAATNEDLKVDDDAADVSKGRSGDVGPSKQGEDGESAAKARQLDMLRQYGMVNIALMFKQLVSLGAVTEEKIAEQAGVQLDGLRPWLSGKAQADVEGAIGTWLLSHVDDVKKDQSLDVQNIGSAAIRKALYGDANYGDPTAIEESFHPYMQSVLDMPRDARKTAEQQVDAARRVVSDGGDDHGEDEGPSKMDVDAAAPRNIGAASDAGADGGPADMTVAVDDGLLAVAPGDEILAEILYYQTHLLDTAVENRKMMFDVLEKLEENLPAINSEMKVWEEGVQCVDQYMEMVRESRRALKREKREKDQMMANARIQASALLSRNASGRGGPQSFIRRHLRGRPSLASATSNVILGAGAPIDDDVCKVCYSSESSTPNVIVYCERCGTAVHQRCYSISRLPKGDWLCWPCRDYEKEHGSHTRPPRWASRGPLPNNAQCSLCPVPYGALKRDTSTNSWIHVACAQWHPEITMRDLDASSTFMGADKIDPARVGLRCCICGKTDGACITCCRVSDDGVKCTNSFHPLCALEKGYDMSVIEDATGKLEYSCYCGEHSLSDGRDVAGLFKDEEVLMEKPSTVLHPNLSLSAFRSGHITVDSIKVDPEQRKSKDDIAAMEKLRLDLERLKLLCKRIVRREQIKLEVTKCGRELALMMLKNPDADQEYLVSTVYPKDVGAPLSAATTVLAAQYGLGGPRKTGATENGVDRQAHYGQDAPGFRRQTPLVGRDNIQDGRVNGTNKRRRGGVVDASDSRLRKMTEVEANRANMKLPEGYLYVPISLLPKEKRNDAKG